MKQTTGLVIGKFMPLHKGHEALLNFADKLVDQLLVVVDNINPKIFPEGYMSEERRVVWIQELLPNAKVFYIKENTPQELNEHPDFWNYWKNTLLDIVGLVPDYLVASEQYGFKLSEVLGCEYMPFNIDRDMVTTCATDIRLDLSNNFQYLAKPVKKDFTARICITGPESTGKSTLAKQLAKEFDTISIPEYARYFTESHIQNNKDFTFEVEHLYQIGLGQVALEDSLISQANKMIISDTDSLVTVVRSKWLCNGKYNQNLVELALDNICDFYILTYPDIEWEKDDIRYYPEDKKRIEFFDDCKKMLDDVGANYMIVKGEGKKRVQMAIDSVKKFMKTNYNYSYFLHKMK